MHALTVLLGKTALKQLVLVSNPVTIAVIIRTPTSAINAKHQSAPTASVHSNALLS
jgi:hypothetical protein